MYNQKKKCPETVEQGVNFEHFTPCSTVSIVNFEHAIAGWVRTIHLLNSNFKIFISLHLNQKKKKTSFQLVCQSYVDNYIF